MCPRAGLSKAQSRHRRAGRAGRASVAFSEGGRAGRWGPGQGSWPRRLVFMALPQVPAPSAPESRPGVSGAGGSPIPQTRSLGLRRLGHPGGGVRQRLRLRGGRTGPQGACPASPLCALPWSPGAEGAAHGAAVRGEPRPAQCPLSSCPGAQGRQKLRDDSPIPAPCVVQPMGLPGSREHIPPCDPESPGLGPARTSPPAQRPH